MHSSFIDNLADMNLLLSKFNKRTWFLLCASEYGWVLPLKNIKIIAAFQIILRESGRNPSKIWVYKDS